MSKEEFLSPFKALYQFFHRGVDPKREVVDQWYNRLEYCDLEDFDRAVDNLIDHGRSMPTPGEIKTACKGFWRARQSVPEYIPLDQIRPASKFGKAALSNVIRLLKRDLNYAQACENLAHLATKYNADIGIALTGDLATDHTNIKRYMKYRKEYGNG